MKRSTRKLESILDDASRSQSKRTRTPVELYLHFLRIERGLSENSLEAYASDLQKLSNFLNLENKVPVRATGPDLQHFLRHLGELNLERTSITRIVSALRGFYRHLLTEKLILSDPTENLDVKSVRRKLPEVLTIEEMESLLSQPDLSTPKGIGLRVMRWESISIRQGRHFCDPVETPMQYS